MVPGGGNALKNKAETFESKKLMQKLKKFSLANISDIDEFVKDTYDNLRPKAVDYASRRELIDMFNSIAKELYGNSENSPTVEVYGSFVMDMFNKQSDLDLSVNFCNPANNIELPRKEKIKALHLFANKFDALQRSGHVTGLVSILTARVPIMKVLDRRTGVECDLSIENRDGILKSELIHIISAIDERFQKLGVLNRVLFLKEQFMIDLSLPQMKAWAKANEINSSTDGTLNSLSIISLVAFHLQTRNPPILPPFSDLFKGGTDPCTVMRTVQNFLSYGKNNEESLGTLFFTLLVKLASVNKLWRRGLCASVYEGIWISKTNAFMSVEDFGDRSENVCRAVNKVGYKKIHGCIHGTFIHLRAYLDHRINGEKLKELLFDAGGSTVSTVQQTVSPNMHKRTKPPIPHEYRTAKRMCVENGWKKTQLAHCMKGRRIPQAGDLRERIISNRWVRTSSPDGSHSCHPLPTPLPPLIDPKQPARPCPQPISPRQSGINPLPTPLILHPKQSARPCPQPIGPRQSGIYSLSTPLPPPILHPKQPARPCPQPNGPRQSGIYPLPTPLPPHLLHPKQPSRPCPQPICPRQSGWNKYVRTC